MEVSSREASRRYLFKIDTARSPGLPIRARPGDLLVVGNERIYQVLFLYRINAQDDGVSGDS